MTVAHRVSYSWQAYLALERDSNVKHEYLDGQIYAMAGGTLEHAALAATFIGLLFGQLRAGPCRVLDSDARVRVEATGLATYPDVTVVCGPREVDRDDPHTVLNPTVLVEVTSPSTDEYDRIEKFEHYRQMRSLRAYVLVSHRERAVEVRTRGDDGTWSTRVAHDGDAMQLDAIGARIDVRELYLAAAPPV